MVYGAFEEQVMKKAYQEFISSPLGQTDLARSALTMCSVLDRLLVEKIWPAKETQKQRLQDKELDRPLGGRSIRTKNIFKDKKKGVVNDA